LESSSIQRTFNGCQNSLETAVLSFQTALSFSPMSQVKGPSGCSSPGSRFFSFLSLCGDGASQLQGERNCCRWLFRIFSVVPCCVPLSPLSNSCRSLLFNGDSPHLDFSAPAEEQHPRSCLAWPFHCALPWAPQPLGTSLLGVHNIPVSS